MSLVTAPDDLERISLQKCELQNNAIQPAVIGGVVGVMYLTGTILTLGVWALMCYAKDPNACGTVNPDCPTFTKKIKHQKEACWESWKIAALCILAIGVAFATLYCCCALRYRRRINNLNEAETAILVSSQNRAKGTPVTELYQQPVPAHVHQNL